MLILAGNNAPPIAAANEYARLLAGHEVAVVEERVLSPGRFLAFSRRRVARLGVRSLLGVYAYYGLQLLRGETPPPRQYSPRLVTWNISTDPAVATFIRQFTPHVVITCFCGLLSPQFLASLSAPVVNTHPGVNPRYRGFGNIWAVLEGQFHQLGYTVHRVDAGIDTGERISVVPVNLAGVPFSHMDTHVGRLAAQHLTGLVLGTELPHLEPAFCQLPSKCYGLPTLHEYRAAQRQYTVYQARQHETAPAFQKQSPRHILVAGASGGMGAALAQQYAAPEVRLTLWGRNAERLDAVAHTCRSAGAEVHVVQQDMRDIPAMLAWLGALHTECPVDMAFLGAGVSSGVLPDGRAEPALDVYRTITVNAAANAAAGACLAECMGATGQGHIVFVSSLAGLYPLPLSPAYSAAKVAIAYYARSLKATLAGTAPRISIIYPGYVDTPMSRRLTGPQPMRWSAQQAAAHIARKLAAGRNTIVFPWLLAAGTLVLHALPGPLARFFARRFAYTVAPDAESPLAPPAQTVHASSTCHGEESVAQQPAQEAPTATQHSVKENSHE